MTQQAQTTTDVQDAFKILDIPEGSSLADIEEAYRHLADVWQPDRYAHDETLKLKTQKKRDEIDAAYRCLCAYAASRAADGATEASAVDAVPQGGAETGPAKASPETGQEPAADAPAPEDAVTAGAGEGALPIKDSAVAAPAVEEVLRCGDEDCSGRIHSKYGRCTICHRTYEEGARAHRLKEERQREQQEQWAHKQKKRRKTKNVVYLAAPAAMVVILAGYFIYAIGAMQPDGIKPAAPHPKEAPASSVPVLQEEDSITAEQWLIKATALWEGQKCTDPKKAVEYLNNAVRLKPDLDAAYLNRGLAYVSLGHFGKAIEDLSQAIRLEPHYTAAYAARAQAHFQMDSVARGCADANQACTMGSCEVRDWARKQGHCN